LRPPIEARIPRRDRHAENPGGYSYRLMMSTARGTSDHEPHNTPLQAQLGVPESCLGGFPRTTSHLLGAGGWAWRTLPPRRVATEARTAPPVRDGAPLRRMRLLPPRSAPEAGPGCDRAGSSRHQRDDRPAERRALRRSAL